MATPNLTRPPNSQLERLERRGAIRRWVDEVEDASCEGEPDTQGPVRLRFRHRAEAVVADRVILATGSTLDVERVPLLASVAAKFALPVAGSPGAVLPDVDEDLTWGEENFHVIGAFALLGKIINIRLTATPPLTLPSASPHSQRFVTQAPPQGTAWGGVSLMLARAMRSMRSARGGAPLRSPSQCP